MGGRNRGWKKSAGGEKDGNGRKEEGKKAHTGGGKHPTDRDSPESQTSSAKRRRSKSAVRKGKFVQTFQEVEDAHTSSDTTSQTKRVTRSQTLSVSTDGSPVKGDQPRISSSQTKAAISETSNQGSPPRSTEEDEQSFFESADASFNEADRRLEAAFGAVKMPWSKPRKALKQSTEKDDSLVEGVFMEEDIVRSTGKRVTLKQLTVSTEESDANRSVDTPPRDESVYSNDLELQSVADSSPARSASEEGEVTDSDGEVTDTVVNPPKLPQDGKQTQTVSGKQPSQTNIGGTNYSDIPSGSQRPPAPQRAKGGPGHQSAQKKAQEDLQAIRRMTQRDAKDKYDQYHFLIDAHMHMMEYTGRYFQSAKEYGEWSREFREVDIPFAFGIEVQHDPAIWSAPGLDSDSEF